MPTFGNWSSMASGLALTDAFLRVVRTTATMEGLAELMGAVTHDMGFRHYALIHHDDLRSRPPGRVDLKDYPAAITERIIGEGRYRRDPIIRGCIFADSAFLWSELSRFITLDRHDRESFELGDLDVIQCHDGASSKGLAGTIKNTIILMVLPMDSGG